MILLPDLKSPANAAARYQPRARSTLDRAVFESFNA